MHQTRHHIPLNILDKQDNFIIKYPIDSKAGKRVRQFEDEILLQQYQPSKRLAFELEKLSLRDKYAHLRGNSIETDFVDVEMQSKDEHVVYIDDLEKELVGENETKTIEDSFRTGFSEDLKFLLRRSEEDAVLKLPSSGNALILWRPNPFQKQNDENDEDKFGLESEREIEESEPAHQQQMDMDT